MPVLPVAEDPSEHDTEPYDENFDASFAGHDDADRLRSDFRHEVDNAVSQYLCGERGATHDDAPFDENGLRIVGPFRQKEHFYSSMSDGECYRVDLETDSLTASDMQDYEELVIAADRSELQNFIDHDVFIPTRRHGQRVIDCTWVRKWKQKPGGPVVKSRLCCRGFLDPQKGLLAKSSSTATRLSQKLLVSTAANKDWILESWDISSAFLQGISFSEIGRIASELGVPSPIEERTVYIVVPGNVWWHLHCLGLLRQISWDEIVGGQWCLKLTKAMYGLVDAPLLWQLSLRHYLCRTMGADVSVHDDNYLIFRDASRPDVLVGAATIHVDDTGFGGKQGDLDSQRKHLEKKFGTVSRQTLPFQHVGITYERSGLGYKLHQKDFCMKLPLITVARGDKSDRDLRPEEVTTLRSSLGGLLYLIYTRPDVSADVVLLGTRVNKSTVEELRTANRIVRRAQQHPDRGFIFLPLRPPLRIVSFSDASFSTSSTSYAVEGVLVLLTSGLSPATGVHAGASMNGRAHLLLHSANKAKRISHSTSHAESLAMYSASQSAEQVAERLTEQCSTTRLTLEDAILLSSSGRYDVRIDSYTDCLDLLELVTGHRGAPQDKSQRLIILSLRERRLIGKMRSVTHVRTTDMPANPLTKHEPNNAQLGRLLHEGLLHFHEVMTSVGPVKPTSGDGEYSEFDLHSMS